MKTAFALANLGAGRKECVSELLDLILGLVQQIQGKSLGRARANARQTLELINQPRQRSSKSAQESGATAAILGRMVELALVLMRLLRSLTRLIACIALAFTLGACAAGPTAGLQSYQSPDGRFAFLYPTGWSQVQVSNGPRVVFHDLIHSDETVSLMVNTVDENNDLTELGSAVAVGERLRREVIATAGSGRTAELVEAGEREVNGHTFYDLEYAVHLEDRDRHELATVVVDRGRLYTLATSTNEERWPKVQDLCNRVTHSLNLLI